MELIILPVIIEKRAKLVHEEKNNLLYTVDILSYVLKSSSCYTTGTLG